MISVKTFEFDLLGIKGRPVVKFSSIFEEIPYNISIHPFNI